MSFAVIHMKKFKSPDIKGMQIHNQREKESQTNMDIDKERSSLNYDLLNHAPIDYDERIQ
ncbi:plasmid recombination protein, partial [Peribacillus butanolivorans]